MAWEWKETAPIQSFELVGDLPPHTTADISYISSDNIYDWCVQINVGDATTELQMSLMASFHAPTLEQAKTVVNTTLNNLIRAAKIIDPTYPG